MKNITSLQDPKAKVFRLKEIDFDTALHCPDCEGEGQAEKPHDEEGWTQCGNCKGWMKPN
tara:strand:+ start:3899 stop:4078 length:180 start_codon:yes stop_codon:yes gene_type:complete